MNSPWYRSLTLGIHESLLAMYTQQQQQQQQPFPVDSADCCIDSQALSAAATATAVASPPSSSHPCSHWFTSQLVSSSIYSSCIHSSWDSSITSQVKKKKDPDLHPPRSTCSPAGQRKICFTIARPASNLGSSNPLDISTGVWKQTTVFASN
jgi:hypothetical protein